MDFPKVIEFQTHNLCNANCIICPYREIHDIKGFMHADLFERILTEVGDRKILLIPYLNNEPFLDPSYCEKLNMIQERCSNCKIEVSTNLSHLDEKTIHQLENIKIDELRISIFGYFKSTYYKMMPGLDYDTVQSNLQLLLKSKLMKQIETIGITMIEHNYVDEKEFFMMQKLCTENHIKFNRWGYLDRAGNNSYWKNNVCRNRIFGCEQNRPLERLHVLYDGSVILCCQDWRKEVVIGSLNDSTITEIWNSDRYNWVRSEIYRGSSCNIDLCKRCKLSV